jgi:hypothetical protein
LGPSFRNTSKALYIFEDKSVEDKRVEDMLLSGIGVQHFGSDPIYKRKIIIALIINETIIQIRDHYFWLWIAIEPVHKSVLGISISLELVNRF